MRTWRIMAGAGAGVLALAAVSAPVTSSAAGGARPSSPAACGAITDIYQSATSLLRACGSRRYLVANTGGMRFSNCKFCWAGYQDQNHSDYFEALASYNEPRLKSVSCSKPVLEGIWVGVGDEKSTIGQSGTTAGTGHSHQSFWEVIGPGFNAPPVFGKNAKPGDKITSFTTYPPGEGAYTFTVMDKSKVILQTDFFTSVYQGKFALYVVEDPQLGKTHPHIPNFGKVTFTNARVARINHPLSKIGALPHKKLTMTNSNGGHDLAKTGSLSGNNKFPVTFSRCK